MGKRIALVFSGHGANDAIRGQMTEYGNALAEIGVSIVHVTTDPAELKYAVDLVLSGQVGFAFTWLGIGQDLSAPIANEAQPSNLWERFGIPFLKIQGDMPAYFVQLHKDTPRTAVNLYASPEYVHFRRRWLPDDHALTGLIPPMPLTPIQSDEVDVSVRRRGRLVFLKNGNSPGDLQRLWRERLPPSLATLLLTIAEELVLVGMRPGLLHIGDFVAERVQDRGMEADSTPYMIRFISAQMDDYLRRVKSQLIAESILDLPVIVQGSHWEHVNFSGRKAQLIAGQDYTSTAKIYAEQLGIIDMSPNVDLSPHERVQRSAGSFTTVLTNRQSCLDQNFPGFEDLWFEFDPDSIRARVMDALAHPDRYIELGVAFGERFRNVFSRTAFANRVADIAEFAALQWSPSKPQIQPFFVWPPPSGR